MKPTASVLLNRLLARGKFRHMQVLLKVAELGSLQRAAAAIGVTQSSVTQTLAYLEQLLDLPLFERHARGVRPTPVCTDLLPVVRQLLQGLGDGAEVLAARQQRGQGVVRLYASVSAIHGLLIDQLPRFGSVHPDISVRLTEAEGNDQLLAIARGEADLVVCRSPAVLPEGWSFVPLREDRLAVFCRVSHAAAGAKRLGWKDLAGYTWLLAPAGTAARERFDALASVFPNPPIAHPVVTRSPTALCWWLTHEDVLAFLPVNLAQPLVDAGEVCELRLRPLVDMPPLGLLQPAGAMTEAARALAEFLRQPVRR